jgi:outer membrane receptor protein involved in Fe transport
MPRTPLLLVLFAKFALAQTGQIQLEVKDPQGAAVMASGTLTRLSAGVTQNFETDAQGRRAFGGLVPGRYRLELAAAGFHATAVLVDVDADTPVGVTVTLEVGGEATRIDVIAATPLPGVELLFDQIPAPVQTVTELDLQNSGAVTLADALTRRLNSVFINEVQGNPFQPDVNYRGYTASPLLGTPQGISVYLDGVRMNQPFGDVVSWDLIPRLAIAETALVPGSDPLFGLNTLGGALAIRTKDGFTNPGSTLAVSGGSYGRRMAELEHGGARGRMNYYGATSLFFEDGWRDNSPSNVRQFIGKLGWLGAKTMLGVTAIYANNQLNGNGLQEMRLLERDYRSVYTKPDVTGNRSPFLNVMGRRVVTTNLTFTGNAYYRYIGTRTFNGDINEESLDQSLYQPNAAERAALSAAGFTGFPFSGENAANTPFPKWRCIANGLLNDEPAEKCNGLLNRGRSQQHHAGVAGQLTWVTGPGANRNQFTAGGAWDRSRTDFASLTQFGYLNPDRSITPIESYADGKTGGVDDDGNPLDTRVDLRGVIRTGSVYATDTFSLGREWNFTLSGRFNYTTVNNRDRIQPGGGPGSLDGAHAFTRFNPAVGVTYNRRPWLNLYGRYSEASRAPTSIELGCADPDSPCRLPNSMAGDPPLKQIVSKTVEAGYRGQVEGRARWSAGWFRAQNTDDILFVQSPQTGFGYFKNFGETRRQGLELDFDTTIRRVSLGLNYTFLDATYQSEEEVNGSGNSSNEDALAGRPGLESAIEIEPGDRIPLTPRHMGKAFADIQATRRLTVNLSMVAFASAYARGNENNRHAPDGVYYLGPGSSPGYTIFNVGGRYQLDSRLQLFAQMNNVFDRRFYTAAQLGPTGFDANGNFRARPFPATHGEFPVLQSTFFAPGAPRLVWGGVRVRF